MSEHPAGPHDGRRARRLRLPVLAGSLALAVLVIVVLYVFQAYRGSHGDVRHQATIKIDGPPTAMGWPTSVITLVFSPDSATLAVATSDGKVRLISSRTGRLQKTLDIVSGFIFCVAFSPDGSLLATGHEDGFVRIWELATGQERDTFRAARRNVWCVTFADHGKQIVDVGSDTKETDGDKSDAIRVVHWELATGKVAISAVVRSPAQAHYVQLSGDGRILATADSDYIGNVENPELWKVDVKLWDTTTGIELATLPGFKDAVRALVFSPEGRELLTGTDRHQIRIWDVENAMQVTEFVDKRAHETPYLVFSPFGKILAARGRHGEAGTARFLAADTGQELGRIELNEFAGLDCAAFSPDGRLLATANFVIDIRDGPTPAEVKIWDCSRLTGKQR